jgi:uncharacterized membrane protein
MPVNKWLVGFVIITSFIGFVDASYLTIADLRGQMISCSVTHGCGTVAHSQFSHVQGIPVALFGVVYYLTIFLLTIWYLDGKRIILLKLISYTTCLGLIASIWFVYVQGAILHAWCQYCLLSAVSSTILFGLGMIIRKKLTEKLSNFSVKVTPDETFSIPDDVLGNQE